MSAYNIANSSGPEGFECSSGYNCTSPCIQCSSVNSVEKSPKVPVYYPPKSSSGKGKQTCEIEELSVDPPLVSINRRPPTIDSVKRAIFQRPEDWKTRVIPLEEVKQHSTAEDCWITAKGKVFNATPFISVHPGGQRSIIRRAGGVKDASDDFDFHSAAGRKIWSQYQIGILEGHESKCSLM